MLRNNPDATFTVFFLAAVLGAAVLAQMPMRASEEAAPYARTSEKTVEGTVERVEQYTRKDARTGTRVVLKTEHGVLDVDLGPAAYLTQNQFSLAEGDRIEVTGSEAKQGRSKVMLAWQVRKGSGTLILRNDQGTPLWSTQPAAGVGAGAGMGMGSMGQGMGMPMGQGMGMRMGMGRGVGMGMPMTAPQKSAAASPVQAIFAQRCAMCHNAHSTETKVGPGLKGLYKKAKLVNGKKVTDQDLRQFFQESHSGMPSFANILTAKEVTEVIAYLKTL
jgi:cytochrome c